MATKKISELESINAADESDVLVIVDVSEGTTKKITKGNLLVGAGHSIEIQLNTQTYQLEFKLKNEQGTVLSTQTLDLPSENAVTNIEYNNGNLVLTKQSGGTSTVDISGLISGLQSEITNNNKLSSDLVDDTNKTNKFTNEIEKATWNGKYNKPSGGIPKTDLSSDVQTSLEKADSALQEHQDITGKEDKSVTGTDTNTYDTTETYNTGDIVVQNEKIYKANQDNVTGTFDATKWDEISLYEYQKIQDGKLEDNYKEIIKLEQKVATQKKIISQNPQVTDTDYEPTLADTIEAPFEQFEVKGHSEQETTEGNQLSHGTLTVSGSKNVDLSDDCVFTFNANTNAPYEINFNEHTLSNILTIPSGVSTIYMKLVLLSGTCTAEYLLKLKNTQGQDIGNIARNGNVASVNVADIDLTNCRFQAYFYGTDKSISNGAKFQIVVSKDSNCVWEKYTGGEASPSPSYEQPIKSAGENVQLFDKDNEEQFLQGITVDNSGVIVSAPTDLTETNYIRTIIIPCKANSNYTITRSLGGKTFFVYESDEYPVLNAQTTLLKRNDTQGKISETIKTSSTAKYLLVKIYNTFANELYTYDELMASIKIELGSQATPWSPYGMGCVNEKIQSKNLFNKDTALIKKYANKFDGTIGTSNGWSASDFIEVNPNTQYIYSGITNIWSDVAGAVFYDKNRAFISSVNSIVQSFTTPSNAKYVRLSIQTETPNNIQFEPGSTATSYVPHEEQNISIPVQQPMMDDDYFDRENNEEVHTWQKIVLDGSSDEDWGIGGSEGIHYFWWINDYSKWIYVQTINAYSTIGINEIDIFNRGEYGLALSYGIRLNLPDIDANNSGTVEQLRAYLAENPITVYVKMKKEAYEKLPFTQEQIDAFNEVDEAYSYKGGTYISSEDEVKARIKVSGLYDLNKLLTRVETLESEV